MYYKKIIQKGDCITMSEDIADWLNYHIEIAEQKIISEFVEDIKKEIDYIKTINNYQSWGEGYRQCIAVDTLEEQLNKNIIKKWEKRFKGIKKYRNL